MGIINCLQCGIPQKRIPAKIKDRNFCSKPCKGRWFAKNVNIKEKHPSWRGGRSKQGPYVFLWDGIGKRKQEHRLVMENFLGRKLERDEIVHHKNEDKTDNRIDNLEVMTRAEHVLHHKPRLKNKSI